LSIYIKLTVLLFGVHCYHKPTPPIPTTQTHETIHGTGLTVQQCEYLDKTVIPNILNNRTNVPNSIIIAQALLESGNGTSPLSKINNNHFGHRNKIGYLVYKTDKDCFNKHIQLLNGRYWTNGDFVGWARNLKNKKYASAKDYDVKLIQIINQYQLYKYDRI
jgi:flagellum-specific peptidoglycan hydrolase FlgJ